MRRPQLIARRKSRSRSLDRQPVQEIIVAVMVADIAEDAPIDEQLQSVTTKEMASGLMVAGPTAKELQ